MELIPAAPAPEFKAIEKWINSEPISIKHLKGKVILLDCWTYTCIFCLRTIPIMKRLQEKYQKYGLQVIQAHSAEYEFARDVTNIHNALSRYDVRNIPVAIDSENKTWDAYGNTYWPKHVLIDQNNFVRYEHAGYGGIKDFEVTIRELLSEEGQFPDEDLDTENPVDEIFDTYGMHFSGIAPEICVGYSRLRRFGNNQTMKPDVPFIAMDPNLHVDNVVYLHGKWIWQREGVKSCSSENLSSADPSSSTSSPNDSKLKKQQSSIIMRYNSAKRVHGIVGPSDNKTARIEVKLDKNYLKEDQLGKDMILKDGISYFDIQWPFIHNLVRTEKAEIHEIEIIPKTDNVVFYTFVFG